MSSSSMCQTVYDTIRTVVYDTVHTSVFDTVHTVSYDTVKVVLDSTFTIDLLNKSQEFYSNSFYWLLGVAGVVAAIFSLVMTLSWNKRLDTEVEKIRNKTDEEVKHVSDKAYNESKKVFEQNVSDLENQLRTMTSKIDSIWSNYVKTFVHQASIAKDNDECLRFCSFAFKAVNCNFNPSLLNEVGLMLTLLEARFLDFDRPNLDTVLCNSLVNQIEIFESHFFEYFVDKSPEEKTKASKFVDRLNTVKDWLGQDKPENQSDETA